MGLRQQVVKGVSWNFLEQIIRQGISIAVTVVVARILSPSDYGLVALSSIFIGFLLLFEDLSIGVALIQKNNLDERYLSTSFWTSVTTGIVLAVTLCAIAPFAANYYDKPLLTSIMIISAANFILAPIGSIHKILLIKKMEFGKLSVINILAAIVGGLASLILALLGLGVWSLVFGGLIATVLITPLVWHLEKWRPHLIFNRSCFKDLFCFSSYQLMFNVFNYLSRNLDNLIVGKYLGVNALGIYTMAYTLMMKPLQQISWSITTVLFPLFSSIQIDIARIRAAYLKVVKGIALITFPMMTGLMMVSREFILVIVGPKWEGVVLPLQVLCLVGALQSIGTTVGSIFNSLGRTDLQFKVGVISSVGHVVGFMVCIRWGLMGLVNGYLATNLIFGVITQFAAVRLIHLSMKEFIMALKMPAINSVIMMLTLIGYGHFKGTFLNLGIYMDLASSVCLGVVVYAVSTLLSTDKKQLDELRGMIKHRKNSLGVTVA